MTYSRFFVLLAIFTVIAAAAAAVAHLFLPISFAIPLTIGAIVLLMGISVLMFYAGQRTAAAENKFLFTNAFMGVTMIKFFLCGGLIAAYALLAEPENKLFVVPFFSTYLIYTALEIVFLVKLAGNTSAKAVE
ncbi:hypothetical protein FUA23_02195 [Neolewinella aurantiaca]|uniref:ATP synthase protein I n=1 Tax=Neolewinella aurantiaca TaxID=2602767 RepID=A0A5C7G155_9BACT|nr:hypothetical protein [Neolewinella aurantiaca]TXF91529.1 hypothetical protein FUA23_02195 [Neolewinella aurantiaca]